MNLELLQITKPNRKFSPADLGVLFPENMRKMQINLLTQWVFSRNPDLFLTRLDSGLTTASGRSPPPRRRPASRLNYIPETQLLGPDIITANPTCSLQNRHSLLQQTNKHALKPAGYPAGISADNVPGLEYDLSLYICTVRPAT